MNKKLAELLGLLDVVSLDEALKIYCAEKRKKEINALKRLGLAAAARMLEAGKLPNSITNNKLWHTDPEYVTVIGVAIYLAATEK